MNGKQRNFNDEFKIGERVAIKRTDHGWLDSAVTGIITIINPNNTCVVTDDSGCEWTISRPRDIYRIQMPNPPMNQ